MPMQPIHVPVANQADVLVPSTEITEMFERKEYEVTDWGCQLLQCICCPLVYTVSQALEGGLVD